MKKNADIARWLRRYQTALRRYLQPGPAAGALPPAAKLGRQAATLGLETLDVIRMHAQALMALVPPGGPTRAWSKKIERAKRFFAETIVPIEKTHRAALQAEVHVHQLTQTLRRRTVESSASTRRLERGIVRRRAVEADLKQSGARHRRLLQESRRLQLRLRHRIGAILLAQEHEREKASRHLQDEIAQHLLAIHVRLLALKKAAKAGSENLKKEIAKTQRMARQSLSTVRRSAHEYGGDHEA